MLFESVRWKITKSVHALVQRQMLAYARMRKGLEHELTLDPNGGQRLKLGNYSFAVVSPQLKIGTLTPFEASDSPCTTLRIERVIINVPCPGFVYLTAIKNADVDMMKGGVEDAYAYSAESGVEVDYGVLPPSKRASVFGEYSGLVHGGQKKDDAFLVTVTFAGPSTIAGGA